jgi:hypothetical protein
VKHRKSKGVPERLRPRILVTVGVIHIGTPADAEVIEKLLQRTEATFLEFVHDPQMQHAEL